MLGNLVLIAQEMGSYLKIFKHIYQTIISTFWKDFCLQSGEYIGLSEKELGEKKIKTNRKTIAEILERKKVEAVETSGWIQI